MANIFKNANIYSVKSRLITLLVTAIIIPTLILGIFSYSSAKTALTDSGMRDLSNILNSSYDLAAALNEEVVAGKITKEEAQKQVQTMLIGPKQADGSRDMSKNMIKVGTTGYIFAQDSKGVLTMHPKSEGQSIWDAQGGVGKMIAENKNGNLRYEWLNPGEKEARYKITVTKYFAPWDWIIAVGSYEEEFFGAANNIKTNIYILLAVELVAGFALAWFMGGRLTKPLVQMGQVMEKLGNGDLQNRLQLTNRRDEYGTLATHFNLALDNLSDLIRNVTDASHQVAAFSEELNASADQTTRATEQIASATQQLAAGSEEQLRSVGEAASSMNQMSAGIQQIAANSEEVTALAEHASEASTRGADAVKAVVSQMNDINQTVQESASIVQTLGNRSKEIGNIVGMITDIANQTNLLALNAAIEAARAGEMGRGFAVVADEVRKLAEQSGTSAQKIAELIGQIQTETENAVASMQQGTVKVTDGLVKTQQVSEVFEVIETATINVTSKAQEVTVTAGHLATGSQQIVNTIEIVTRAAEDGASASQETSAASQEQLATMEEVASSAQSLSRLAEELQLVLTKFKL